MRIALTLLASGLLLAVNLQATEKLETLTLSGPPAVVSWPLIHMAETGALDHLAEETRFELWTNPDQLRVTVLHGKADYVATPVNVAANFHNRGAPIRLLNVSTWGILWMVSRDPDKTSIEDFRGETVVVPFRGDMPDILLNLLCQQAGMELGKDIKARYVAAPPDAVQLLIARRERHALLAEPAVSMALRKTDSFPHSVVAPELSRSFAVHEEWGRLFNVSARIPQAGIASLGKGDPQLDQAVAEAYAKSLQWCLENPEQSGKLVASVIERLTPETVEDALAVSPMDAVPIEQAAPALKAFFEQLHAVDPGLIGGKLPPPSFYGAAAGQQ